MRLFIHPYICIFWCCFIFSTSLEFNVFSIWKSFLISILWIMRLELIKWWWWPQCNCYGGFVFHKWRDAVYLEGARVLNIRTTRGLCHKSGLPLWHRGLVAFELRQAAIKWWQIHYCTQYSHCRLTPARCRCQRSMLKCNTDVMRNLIVNRKLWVMIGIDINMSCLASLLIQEICAMRFCVRLRLAPPSSQQASYVNWIVNIFSLFSGY